MLNMSDNRNTNDKTSELGSKNDPYAEQNACLARDVTTYR